MAGTRLKLDTHNESEEVSLLFGKEKERAPLGYQAPIRN